MPFQVTPMYIRPMESMRWTTALVATLATLAGCGDIEVRNTDHEPPPGQEPWDPEVEQHESERPGDT